MTRDSFEYLTTALLVQTANADSSIDPAELKSINHYVALTLDAMGRKIDEETYVQDVIQDLDECNDQELDHILLDAIKAWSETPQITRRVMFDALKKVASKDTISERERIFLERLKAKWSV